MWPNRYSSCSTNIYKLDAYAGALGFGPELRHYESKVPSPCGLTVVYKMSPLLNSESRDRLYWDESTINQDFFIFFFFLDCALDVGLPDISSNTDLTCRLYDTCTGVSCCVDVDEIQTSLEAYVIINGCDQKLEIGVERLNFTVSLGNYPYGMFHQNKDIYICII